MICHSWALGQLDVAMFEAGSERNLWLWGPVQNEFPDFPVSEEFAPRAKQV